MKKIILVLLWIVSFTLTAQESGIQFINDTTLANALANAKQENKLLFVDCYTSWCSPCRYMEKNIFTLPEVAEFYNSHFICWKVDTEKLHNPADIAAFSNYHILAWPTFLFLNEKGEIMHRAIGADSASNFIELGKTALATGKNYYSLQEKVKSGDRTAETLLKYYSCNFQAPEKYINEHFALISDSVKLSQPTWNLFSGYARDIQAEPFKFFVSHRQQYEQKFSKKAVETKLVNLFDYYNRPGKDSLCNVLKQVDTVLFAKNLQFKHYRNIVSKYTSHPNDKKSWSDLIAATTAGFSSGTLSVDELNNTSWLVYVNYKKFRDKDALKKGGIWSKKAVDAQPNSHACNDTYAHILFDLRNKKEAIEREELALKIAAELNFPSQIKFYTDELNKFKGKR